uniref:MAT1-1-10 protein n=1 Tax=Morchella sp. Mes-20 TaxID=1175520 RepID=A0A510AL06_9PEZI|nr:mating type protein MAT1-1-10 [Morchella sp. Mes-20]QQL94622.1 MAT1-1-10 protein [Morchella sp. Mes-20]
MPQPYLSYKDHFILNDQRREAILRLGRVLIQTKNDLTFFPRTPYSFKIRKAIIFCTDTLKEFKIKNLHPALLDRHKDIYPLANLYNLGVQILALREVNIRLERDIEKWNCGLKTLQGSLPEDSCDVRLILVEVHEFLAFATIANQIHPFHTLTPYSIRCAAKAAQNSRLLTEAAHTLSILRAAFSIQNELQIRRTSKTTRSRIISNAVSLPKVALNICSDWYNYRGSHALYTKIRRNEISTPIPFEKLVTWFTNARRRIIKHNQAIRPGLKAIVDEALSSKRSFKTDIHIQTRGSNGDDDPEWEIPLSRMIAEFLDELGDAPHELDPPSNLVINNFGSGPPILPTLLVDNNMDKVTQGCQQLLKSIYSLFNEISCACLDIFQRAYWLDERNRYSYTLGAKRDMDYNCLRAISVLLGTRESNETYFEWQNHSRSDLFEAIFDVFPNPNITEEEYLSKITGMNVNQIHTWCEKSFNH